MKIVGLVKTMSLAFHDVTSKWLFMESGDTLDDENGDRLDLDC